MPDGLAPPYGLDRDPRARKLRAAFPDVHVIMVTQHDDAHPREAALEAGACGYVLKQDLLELRRLLAVKDPVRPSADEGDVRR